LASAALADGREHDAARGDAVDDERVDVIRNGPHSMLNLKPLIARLAEDVLLAIRGATFAELRELVAPSDRASTGESPAPLRAPVPGRRVRRRLPGRIVADSQSRDVSDRADPGSVVAIRDQPAGGDITDPESLLAMTPSPKPQQVPAPDEGGVPAGPEEAPPPSSVRLVRESVMSLRPGESLASALGAGIVIRRAKKAG
jgi:hypothetical protein